MTALLAQPPSALAGQSGPADGVGSGEYTRCPRAGRLPGLRHSILTHARSGLPYLQFSSFQCPPGTGTGYLSLVERMMGASWMERLRKSRRGAEGGTRNPARNPAGNKAPSRLCRVWRQGRGRQLGRGENPVQREGLCPRPQARETLQAVSQGLPRNGSPPVSPRKLSSRTTWGHLPLSVCPCPRHMAPGARHYRLRRSRALS